MKELDWIVNLLVNLHSFCERNGLSTLSDRLAEAIEEAAPMIRGNRIDRETGQDTATNAHSALQGPVEHGPRGHATPCRPRLIYDAAVGTKP